MFNILSANQGGMISIMSYWLAVFSVLVEIVVAITFTRFENQTAKKFSLISLPFLSAFSLPAGAVSLRFRIQYSAALLSRVY